MADLFEHFAGGPALPKRSVILTFDDGYDDVYEHAFPLLMQRGMVGTFFITTDFVERPGYVTWDQIIEMAEPAWRSPRTARTRPISPRSAEELGCSCGSRRRSWSSVSAGRSSSWRIRPASTTPR